MVRTKHVLVFLLLIGVLLLALIAYLLATGTRKESVTYNDATFKEGEDELEIIVTRSGKDDSVRDSLIEKLGENGMAESSASAEAEEGKEIETEEVLVTGGFLLGDGKISTNPRIGYIYSCAALGDAGGRSAEPWIEGSFWYDGDKANVDGAVLSQGSISISEREGARLITSNGLPSHTTGVFPVAQSDDAYAYDEKRAPGVSIQDLFLQLPAAPPIANAPSCIPVGVIGVGLNGVPIYSGLDSAGNDAGTHEMFDSCGGHPDGNGVYHYHRESECLLSSYFEGGDSTLVGYARDGFGIFSNVENGEKLENADLDACHGHEHVIPWSGSFVAKYHYHMTDEYPYTLGCFMGNPAEVGKSSDIPKPAPPPPPQNTPSTTPTTTPEAQTETPAETDTPATSTSP